MKATPTQYARCLYDVTENISPGSLPDVLDAFLRILRSDRMMSQLDMIISLYREIWNEKHATVDVQVITRHSLSEAEKRIIQDRVQAKYPNRSITPYFETDESCIGGLRLVANGEVTDLTVANRLLRLRKELAQ